MFRKATKAKAKLRLALVGPSGTGKTYTALSIAKGLGDSIAVIDTERGSASKYAGDVADFEVCELEEFSPVTYVKAIDAARELGAEVLIIDSLSHAWTGTGGALDQVDRRGGKFQAWREVTPMHRALVDAILGYPGHVVATMRAKTEYVVDKGKNGRTEVRKLGLAPVQRDGVEYEFDVVGDLDQQHNLTVTKSRCPMLADQVIRRPGKDVADTLKAWLSDGVDPVQQLLDELAAAKTQAAVTSIRNRAVDLHKQMSSSQVESIRDGLEAATKRVLAPARVTEAAESPTEEESAA